MQRHSVENDWVAVEKNSRSGRIDLHLSQTEGRVDVVHALVVRDGGDLEHVERGKARAPEVGGADRERRGDADHRGPTHLAEACLTIEQRLRVGRYQARRVWVQ